MIINKNGISPRCNKEYEKRMNLVLNYIDNNYNQKITVHMLAEVACFSAYHFHRVFTSIVGEPPMTYIKRIRLNKAAYKILYCPELSIAEVALDCGFSSHSDFSRSFKTFFGVAPKKYTHIRKYKAMSRDHITKNVCPVFLYNIGTAPNKKMIHIVELSDLYVAYIRCVGLSRKLKNKKIESAFTKLYHWALPRGYISNQTEVLGIILDSPEIDSMDRCRYDACITVSEDCLEDGEIWTRQIRAKGTYVTFSYTRNKFRSNKEFFSTVDYIYGQWMPLNGYFPDDKPFLEFYREDVETQKINTSFYIPIKPI